MEMKFKILDDKFVIEKDDVLITLTFDEIRKLNSSIGRIGHDKDVKKEIKNRGIIVCDDTFERLADEYHRLREINAGLSWEDCLDAAFENSGCEYGDELTDEMWTELKEFLLLNHEDAAEYLEIGIPAIDKLTQEDLGQLLDKQRNVNRGLDVEFYECMKY